MYFQIHILHHLPIEAKIGNIAKSTIIKTMVLAVLECGPSACPNGLPDLMRKPIISLSI